MSMWIHMKSKDGRDRTLLVDAPVLLPLFVVTVLSSQVLLFYLNTPTRVGWHGMGLMVAGLMALAVAKASRFRHGEWRSWGPKRMSKPFRMVYYLAYVLMTLGLAMAILYLIWSV